MFVLDNLLYFSDSYLCSDWLPLIKSCTVKNISNYLVACWKGTGCVLPAINRHPSSWLPELPHRWPCERQIFLALLWDTSWRTCQQYWCPISGQPKQLYGSGSLKLTSATSRFQTKPHGSWHPTLWLCQRPRSKTVGIITRVYYTEWNCHTRCSSAQL